MPDEQVTTQPVVTQGNAEAARTETGEIKDQQTTQAVTTPEATTTDSSKAKTSDKQTTSETKLAEPGTVPDKYTLTAPEGFEIDPKVLADAEPVFKELGLSNEAAQKLTDIWNKHSIETTKALDNAITTQRNTWRGEIAKSTDLGDGNEGFKPEVRKNIDTAISAIGDPKAITAFKEALDFTGAGDNPAIARALNTLGKLLSEGTAVRAGAPAPVKAPGSAPPSAAAAMYPNLPTSSRA
jgi:hypothetical protein